MEFMYHQNGFVGFEIDLAHYVGRCVEAIFFHPFKNFEIIWQKNTLKKKILILKVMNSFLWWDIQYIILLVVHLCTHGNNWLYPWKVFKYTEQVIFFFKILYHFFVKSFFYQSNVWCRHHPSSNSTVLKGSRHIFLIV